MWRGTCYESVAACSTDAFCTKGDSQIVRNALVSAVRVEPPGMLNRPKYGRSSPVEALWHWPCTKRVNLITTVMLHYTIVFLLIALVAYHALWQ
jgi:hypothetical protein